MLLLNIRRLELVDAIGFRCIYLHVGKINIARTSVVIIETYWSVARYIELFEIEKSHGKFEN